MFILMFLTLTRRKRFVALASATIDWLSVCSLPFKINFESIRAYASSTASRPPSGSGLILSFRAAVEPSSLHSEQVLLHVVCATRPYVPTSSILMIYDTDEDCRNPVTLDKKWDWAEHALYPTRSISEPTLVLWCGNIIAKDCCITRAGHLANSWDIVNIRDAAGRSTWPQKNKEEQIDRILSKISVKAQQGEYFNNPVAEGKIFKNLPYGKVPPLSKFRFLIGYGDPAYSDSRKKASSTKALVLVGKLKGVYYVIKAFLARETNANFISWYFAMDDYVAHKANVYWYMENNKLPGPVFNQVFRPLLREQCRDRRRELYIKGDDRKKTDKATRIEADLEPIDRECRWVFNEQERDNPMMQETHKPVQALRAHAALSCRQNRCR